MLVHELPRLKSFRADLKGGRVQRTGARDAWGPFILLGGVIALRSFVYFGFVTFIPLYFLHDLHTSKALGQRRADRDARGWGGRDADRRPARGPLRPPRGAARLDGRCCHR